jgi:DNA polymerase-3 subunit gamma/tau
MAHRALTLKYRPQVFADLVGQDHVSAVLARALEGGRVAHAYLFTGARGVGKTTSARILAKALNCERRASGDHRGPDPCNACTSCGEITSGVSLDVAEIDGASNRGIADVQALREKVRFVPTGGRHRVVIIDEVHQLSNDAFAALLKTLEEPPPHLVFIFATTDPQKLPDTIRSRCQRFDFARVPIRKVADRLLDITARERQDPEGVNFTLTEGAALLIAHKSEGALRDAVSALDQVVSSGETDVDETHVRRILGIADREAFFALADAIVQRDPKAALRAVHRAFEKGIDARELAEGLSEHIRHILILKVDPEGADLVAASGEDVERLRGQGEGWSEGDLLRLLRIASEVLWPMRDSPQPLVHLEAAIMQMATLEPGDTLSEILERLEALELRLGGAASAPAPASSGRAGAAVGRPAAGSRTSGGGAPRASAPDPVVASAPASSPVVPPAPASSPVAAPAPASNLVVAPAPAPPRAIAVDAGPGARSAATAAPASLAREPATGAEPAAPLAGPTAGTALAEDEACGPSEDVERRWREVVAAVYARKRMLGAFLEESRFLGSSAAGLILATDDLHRSIIDDRANRVIIAEEVARAFGQPLPLTCGPADATALAARSPSPADTKQMIERAIRWFDGEAVTPARRGRERTDA